MTKKWDSKLAGRKPGSRRWQAIVDRNGGDVPRDLQFVQVDLVCDIHPNTIVGQFVRHTYDGASPNMWMRTLPDGTAPEATGDYSKVLLFCPEPGCRLEGRLKPGRVEAALDDIFEPHAVQRVVTYKVADLCYAY